MSTLGGFYANPHESQYAAGSSTTTRTSGCTWTTGANGANAATGGKVSLSPDQVHALVKPAEETNANTPGWSLPDLELAMSRAGVAFDDATGQGWATVETAHKAGLYLAVQGDSDQFGSETCSGAFDGDHCIGIHPASYVDAAGVEWWRIDDPICRTARWEKKATIRAYAEKLHASIRFGVYKSAVPKTVAPPAKYRVRINAQQIRQAVPVYDRPYGKVIGHVRHATYITTRTRSRPGLRWWYRVISTASGLPTNIAGRYLPAEPNPPMTVTPIPGGTP